MRTAPACGGPYGFYDALNPEEGWYSDTYIAIDHAPIVVMIENYRSRLCWRLFMSSPEIKPTLQSIGWTFAADLDGDGDVSVCRPGRAGRLHDGPGECLWPRLWRGRLR